MNETDAAIGTAQSSTTYEENNIRTNDGLIT